MSTTDSKPSSQALPPSSSEPARAPYDRFAPRPHKNPGAAEVEAIRRLGLTTVLKRHLSEAMQKVAANQAAAEAADRDLQTRKDATGEFVASRGRGVSLVDAFYLSLKMSPPPRNRARVDVDTSPLRASVSSLDSTPVPASPQTLSSSFRALSRPFLVEGCFDDHTVVSELSTSFDCSQYKTPNGEGDFYSHERTPDMFDSSHSVSSYDDALFIEQAISEATLDSCNDNAQYVRTKRWAQWGRLAVLAVAVLAVGGGAYYWACVATSGFAAEPKVLVKDEQPSVDGQFCVVRFEDVLRSKAKRLVEQENLAKVLVENEPPSVDRQVCVARFEDVLRSKAKHVLEQERLVPENHRRPWVCNIPFVYMVHPRCRRLASESPVFDLEAIFSTMMQ